MLIKIDVSLLFSLRFTFQTGVSDAEPRFDSDDIFSDERILPSFFTFDDINGSAWHEWAYLHNPKKEKETEHRERKLVIEK